MNKVITFDVEVFAHDWLFFAKSWKGHPEIIWNDGVALRDYMLDHEDYVFLGFNNKHYDNFIVQAICTGADNAEVKGINDYIIGGGRGWDHPYIRENRFWFNSADIRDDMQMGLSLKAIEGHLGMPVLESTVPFDLDRPLTPEEREETEKYCGHDVDTTRRLIQLRRDYLVGKMSLGEMKGLAPEAALRMTNAKLTAAYLEATPEERTDEREYEFPPNLILAYISQRVQKFFLRMGEPGIDDEALFKSKLDFEVGTPCPGGCPCTVGFGGIHGARPCYQEEAADTRVIRNYDVASLYPSLMVHCGYTSRNIPTPEHFREIYETRLRAKREGDKATADTLKLVLNTTYGAMLNPYNPLFDPKMGRSVCISGQLFLLELAERYVLGCNSLRLIQLNTDGILVSLEEADLPALEAINREWQERTHFTLEEDQVVKIVQKDVNNYLMVTREKDGELKTKVKGGYLSRGIAPAGAWNINNNAPIVAEAIIAYLRDFVAPEDTIGACDDIFQFQLIAKAGTKYREAYHLVDGERLPVQKVNRVYAVTDERYGRLYKVKAETEAEAKIESLPERCRIDNKNCMTLAEVDKGWYMGLAWKRINDFLGIKEEKPKKQRGGQKKMASKPMDTPATDNPVEVDEQQPKPRTPKVTKGTVSRGAADKNVFQKLLEARLRFQQSGVKPSGKHMQLEFKYFELSDIVPVAMPIFAEIGLIPVVTFTEELATLTMINADAPEEQIAFTSPMREYNGPVSKSTGKQATSAMQDLGSAETYQRRYLYMVALDITEQDTINPEIEGKPVAAAPKPKAPATPAKRAEAKAAMTAPADSATEFQVGQLKKGLGKLRELDSSQEGFIKQVIKDTEKFTKLSKAACEQFLLQISEMIAEAEGAKA